MAAACERAVALAMGEDGGSAKNVVETLLSGKTPAALVAASGPQCGRPVLPMLPVMTDHAETALWNMVGSSFLAEPSYVGERVQLHKQADGRLAIYGIGGQDLTARFGEGLLAGLRTALAASKECILDAVLMGAGAAEGPENPAGTRLMAFDCLLSDGERLTRRCLRERREALKRAVRERKELRLARATEFALEVPPTQSQLAAVLEKAPASVRGDASCGLVLKAMDSQYEAGITSRAWLEVANLS